MAIIELILLILAALTFNETVFFTVLILVTLANIEITITKR